MTVTVADRFSTPVTIGVNSSSPLKIHRVVMAPLTRMRNTTGTQVPTDMATTYYNQRASKGGLLITEATFISREAGGYPNAPGIYSEEQVEAWKKVTDSVHSKGGYIFMQLWAIGRANSGDMEGVPTKAPSAIPIEGGKVPVELTEAEIEEYFVNYRKAAENAKRAGFDGVELHSANGYLPDQFLQSVSNKRTDKYGGSIENRMRFGLRALEELVSVWGQERVGIRTSAWGTFQGMLEKNPYDTFMPYLQAIHDRYPQLGYTHITEARPWAWFEQAEPQPLDEGVVESNDAFRAIFRGVDLSSYASPSEYAKTKPHFADATPEFPTVIISASGHNAENVREHVERTGDAVAIGRYFIANPDLPNRLFNKLPVNHYDRDTFYSSGPHGYTDLPTYEEEQKAQKVAA